MTVKTYTALQAQADADLANNTNRQITPAKLRTMLKDITDSAMGFETRAAVAAATVHSSRNYLTTLGYAAPGDFGRAMYKRVASEPAHTGKVQSADGAWWELAETIVTLEMFGGKADGAFSGGNVTGTDNTVAMHEAMKYAITNDAFPPYGCTPAIQLGLGTYGFQSTVKIVYNVTIRGASGSGMGNAAMGSRLIWPRDTKAIHLFSASTVDPDTGVAPGTDATGATLENFVMASVVGTDRTKHAIHMQARACCRGLRIANFSGNGYHITADAASGFGNVNCWHTWGGRVSGCQNGIFTRGGDANAGAAYHVDCSSNRQCGILDRSFLGNDYYGCHENGNSTLAKVMHEGNKYYAKQAVALYDDPSPLSTTVPGTDDDIWEPVTTSASGFVEWVEGNEYCPGGQKVSTNSNGRTGFWGGYSEGGHQASYIVSPAAIIGGFNASGIKGTGFVISDRIIKNAIIQGASAVEAVLASSGIATPLTVHNSNDSITLSIGARIGLYSGFMADGVTKRPAGAMFAVGGSASANGTVGLEYYDVAAAAFARALECDGRDSQKTVVPGADLIWSLGSFARRWLKGWFGNISLFPAASVTPANNGEVTFELTNDTALTIKVRGSDGVVRSGVVNLAA